MPPPLPPPSILDLLNHPSLPAGLLEGLSSHLLTVAVVMRLLLDLDIT